MPSKLERNLSHHIRHFLPHVFSHTTIYRLSYIIALLTAITSGFISLISLFSIPWQTHLYYTSKQINTIASWTMLGMYLTPPFLGIMADTHGPITLSWLSLILFVPSYAYTSFAFNHPSSISYLLTIICFINIGIATSALYFCALITCAKLYPERKLLSISLPTTSYGISSLVGSQLLRYSWFFNGRSYLDLNRVFSWFSWIYLIICLLSWIATSFITLLSIREEEERKVKQTSSTSVLNNNNNNDDTISIISDSVLTINERTPLVPVQSKEEATYYLKQFLTDPTSYLLALSMFLSLGPMEMFVTDMGSLTDLLIDSNDNTKLSAELLSFYSIISTFIRLFTGILTDYFIKIRKSPRWILLSFLLLTFFSQFYILILTNYYPNHNSIKNYHILIMGGLMGASYGGMFTIYPTIVLLKYGQAHFGTVYGSLMTSPALGAAFACMIYAHIYDARCSSDSLDTSKCIAPMYKITTVQLILSLFLTITILRIWRHREIRR